jgi:hypothetical protein
MTAKKMPKLSIVNFLICGAGILIFILLMVYPNHTSLAKMDSKINRITAHGKEQKMLFPLFQELMRVSQEKDIEVLPFPEKENLKRNELGNISFILQEIAQKTNLHLTEATPDIDSLIDDSDHFKMYMKLEGSFFDLRNFLIRLGAIPYLEHLEQLQIQTDQTSEDLRMSLKIWLARDKTI